MTFNIDPNTVAPPPQSRQRTEERLTWVEVKAYCLNRIDRYQAELVTCDLDKVERIRGRIEALRALLDAARIDQTNQDSTY